MPPIVILGVGVPRYRPRAAGRPAPLREFSGIAQTWPDSVPAMPALFRPRLTRGRVLASAVVLALVAALVGWAAWPDHAAWTTHDEMITVRSGPAGDQPVALDTRL